jgi:hypothetical protein
MLPQTWADEPPAHLLEAFYTICGQTSRRYMSGEMS